MQRRANTAPPQRWRHRAISSSGIVLTLLLSLSVGGCANKGGTTTCKHYRSHDTKGRGKIIQKMLSQRDASSSPADVDATQLSVDAYCFTHDGTANIQGIYGNGQ